MKPEMISYRFGYAMTRPEIHGRVVIVEPTRLDRIIGALSDIWWAFLVAIAPALPVIGALVGVMLFGVFAR